MDLEVFNSLSFYDILFLANSERIKNKGNKIELCAIINAKSGRCPEDCAFCAQSSWNKASIAVYPLMNKEMILEKALEALKYKVKRFSIVTSGIRPSRSELIKIAETVQLLRKHNINTCASLGLLSFDEICYLKDYGLMRLHCNIETSERFFSKICTTHSFRDKTKTLEAAKKAEISLCSGGIFGMGEDWLDRFDMAMFLKKFQIDSIAINFLTPIKGTPLENMKILSPLEALKIIALFRIILPDKDIRVCGGRPLLDKFSSWIFLAGANALMTGDYLTTKGISYTEDLNFIEMHGLEVDYVVS